MRIPLGDADLLVELRIPALRRPRLVWHLGPVRHTAPPATPIPAPPFLPPSPRKVDLMASLLDDQKVSFSVSGTDDVGNPVPLTGTPAYSVDRPDILALVDNGDGTGSVSATGVLGTAVLSVADTETSGSAFAGSVSIDVLASNVAAVAISLGAPEHV